MTTSRKNSLASFSYGDADVSPENHRISYSNTDQSEAEAIVITIAGAPSSDRTTPKIRPTRTIPTFEKEPVTPPRQRSVIDEYFVEPSTVDTAADRLDSAVELLSTINRRVKPEREPTSTRQVDRQNEPVSDVSNPFTPLIFATSNARNRSGAVVAMVEWLAKSIPGCSVRCGIGTTKIKRLFDSRLGWLGAESSLHRELGARWQDYLEDDAASTFTDSQICLRLQRPGQHTHALLCISGLVVSPILFERLKTSQALLGSVLFGRPAIASVNWSAMGSRPRVALVTAISMVLLLLVCPTPYPAACSVQVEPINARVVSAPFEATIETVLVEPGSEVKAGQPLVTLDGRPLRLEQQSLGAEIQQSTKQRDVAMAAGKIAESQLAQLKVQQLSRQQELIERRLKQLTILSPIDGVIVAGDLRRSIGAALETGQVMLEVASLDRVMIEIEIPEREIGLVNDSSITQFRVDSARVGTVHAALKQIYPAAELRDEESVFLAPIEIDNLSHQYRPGMRGKATVYGPIRPWAWPHVRGLFEQLTWTLGM